MLPFLDIQASTLGKTLDSFRKKKTKVRTKDLYGGMSQEYLITLVLITELIPTAELPFQKDARACLGR